MVGCACPATYGGSLRDVSCMDMRLDDGVELASQLAVTAPRYRNQYLMRLTRGKKVLGIGLHNTLRIKLEDKRRHALGH